LPAIYPASDSPDAFLERFLANFEGFYTAIEEQIEHLHLLLDARTALAPDLPWLAGWFGLALDPQWNEHQRRFLVRYVDRFYRWRGTVCGLAAMISAYLEPAPDEQVFCTGSSSRGQVRLVERFLTRQIRTAPAAPGTTVAAIQLSLAAGAAHRFDVLVPTGLDDTSLAMIQRIVDTTRPAHTWYDIVLYYDLFVVGQARLGLDTTLGGGPRFAPLITGQGALASGYLGFPYPYDIPDRVVLDRDRVGAVPQL
jgi:phage tail-like protein